ncbi:hypothetical protein F2Q69_00019753 [Brassica cretica]|uniref:Uncharacterized protein n=1 Tax=Brassica cretica TaxID=69181 RepID=A0A8S9Q2W4_BRACR|nr:hypothetical protein F2Q69_00019753 [Brassica cretica]
MFRTLTEMERECLLEDINEWRLWREEPPADKRACNSQGFRPSTFGGSSVQAQANGTTSGSGHGYFFVCFTFKWFRWTTGQGGF